MAKLNFPDPNSLPRPTPRLGSHGRSTQRLDVWSSEAGEIPGGGDVSVDVGDTRPSLPSQGDLWFCTAEREDGGGRLYVYYMDADSGQWVDVSQPGGGFSGDYNDLINRPNIPPEFNLDEGSYVNDIIHWAQLGSVQEISSTETGNPNTGASYSDIAATGGSGSGLICNVIRRKFSGAHEVYVAVPGQDYKDGDSVFLDLKYADTSHTGSSGINCTIGQVNETVDGWVARPGSEYFVSIKEDSLVTGEPQFMLGASVGGQPAETTDASAALTVFPIGDKQVALVSYKSNQVTHQYNVNKSVQAARYFYRTSDDGNSYGPDLSYIVSTSSGENSFGFNFHYNKSADNFYNGLQIRRDGILLGSDDSEAVEDYYINVYSSIGRVFGVRDETEPSFSITIDPSTNTIASQRAGLGLNISSGLGIYNFKNSARDENTGRINAGHVVASDRLNTDIIRSANDNVGGKVSVAGLEFESSRYIRATGNSAALSLSSTNAKYNFLKTDGSIGWQIDAEAGTAVPKLAYVMPVDSANPANYDAEGKYIGPTQDLVSKIETLQQEKADLLATVNDLVARVTALEGA